MSIAARIAVAAAFCLASSVGFAGVVCERTIADWDEDFGETLLGRITLAVQRDGRGYTATWQHRDAAGVLLPENSRTETGLTCKVPPLPAICRPDVGDFERDEDGEFFDGEWTEEDCEYQATRLACQKDGLPVLSLSENFAAELDPSRLRYDISFEGLESDFESCWFE